MGKLFDPESPVMQGLSKLSDMVVLNILCVLCSIPIFTIGAAVTALYDSMWRLQRDEGHIFKAFFKALKSNFKQATAQWLFLLVTGTILAASLYPYINADGSDTRVMLVVLAVLAVLWCAITAWVFPLQSRFYNSVINTFLNALLCSLAYLPNTFGMIILNMLPWALLLMWPVFFFRSSVVFVVIWFAMIANLNLQIIKKPFDKMIKDINAEAAHDPDQEQETE